MVKDRRRTQELSCLVKDPTAQWGHGHVNMATHSFTLTHNLVVARARFHDNRQAEREKKKESGSKIQPLSQKMKSCVRMMYYPTHKAKE